MLLGLIYGTSLTLLAVKREFFFISASGVSLFAFVNATLFSGVIKWGSNLAGFAAGFVMGDRIMHAVKQGLLPTREQNVRGLSNYVAGGICAGAMVGVMPW
uniref:Uncharacterized protein n=1 Tax=Lygus hesperus TaxID=30085 RepID=A0A146MBL7_LYGHE